MHTYVSRICAFVLFAMVATPPAAAQVRLIDMIPDSRSGETNQDAEPTIAVDPLNFMHMAGSAFTWDNLTGGPMVTNTAPVYVSTDRGNTWTMALIVPSQIGAGFPTGDITLSFSSTLSGASGHATSWLYGGTLSSAVPGRPMTVIRAQDPFTAAVMATLDTRAGNVDQPHTNALTSMTGEDKLYVGFNNGYGCLVAPLGRSSTLDVSQDAKVATPTFSTTTIESRDSACQDGFAQVAAPHRDGTVYAAFIHDWSGSPRMVVVRDDNWGTGSTPFQALTDPSDSRAGRFIAPAMTLASGTMGQNRLGASNVSIAVDPRDSDRVYVAWGDSGGSNSETIHLRRSVNRGVDWSTTDLLTVTNAMNPQVAISSVGTVGVLYQQVISDRWETHLVRTTDIDGTTFDTPGVLLANQSATTPPAKYSPYIGDYASLIGTGRNFIGMFSASNFPDKANFYRGIHYQRHVDWTAHKLYTDATHTTEVTPSIDPFFFQVNWSICAAIPGICNICKTHPKACYPIYDPWWKFKCPQCTLQILVRPGEEIIKMRLYDNRRHVIGTFARLKEPVTVRGISYTYSLKMKAKKGASYVLKARASKGKRFKGDFNPTYLVRKVANK
jgi:hypothetical protein